MVKEIWERCIFGRVSGKLVWEDVEGDSGFGFSFLGALYVICDSQRSSEERDTETIHCLSTFIACEPKSQPDQLSSPGAAQPSFISCNRINLIVKTLIILDYYNFLLFISDLIWFLKNFVILDNSTNLIILLTSCFD